MDRAQSRRHDIDVAVRTCGLAGNAANDEACAVGVPAVAAEEARRAGLGGAFQQARLIALAARGGDGNLREDRRRAELNSPQCRDAAVCIDKNLRHNGAGAIAELSAGDVGVGGIEEACADLAPGALEEDLELSGHPVGDGRLVQQPDVAFLCMGLATSDRRRSQQRL